MKRIGFIGIGIMGKPMCKNLINTGFKVTVYDINPEAVNEAVKFGAEAGTSPKNVAQNSDVIITMLPDSSEVNDVILGDNGVIYGANKDSIVIDMSSIDPEVSRKISAKLAENGIRMIDAPVSGGQTGAIKGSLAIMVGGRKEDLDENLDILKAMGACITHTGDIGSGNYAKLANQIIVALNIAAISEAFVFAKKSGLNLETLFNAIRSGLAGSNVLEAKTPLIINHKFDPGFKIRLHIKDLLNAMRAAERTGAILPLTSIVLEFMKSLKSQGIGELDHSALIKFYENVSLDIKID